MQSAFAACFALAQDHNLLSSRVAQASNVSSFEHASEMYWMHQGGPNQVLRLAASREGGGPETRSGLKCCPCQQKRAARLPSAAPGSIKRGGPETRSGTVQSLKCCFCQQKRAARLPKCCAWQHQGGGAPKRARVPSRA